MENPKLELSLELQQEAEEYYYCPEHGFIDEKIVIAEVYRDVCPHCDGTLQHFDYLPLDM